MRVVLFIAVCLPMVAASGISFLTLGDWGGAALEEPSKPYSKNVVDVATAMAANAKANDAKFVVNTGDNFYWCGIQNTSDFQIAKDWTDTYFHLSGGSLDIPWYGVLGNHEYGYNVQAQIDMAKVYKNWVMDDRYYTKRVQLSGSNYATFIYLDTSPCITEYRATSQKGWDPCGTEYPTCSLSGGHDDFEGSCHFHENIMSQDCSKQFQWFQSTLAAVPKDDWLIVVGHHPADDIDEEDFTSTMQSHGIDLYLNGHTHCLTHYQVDGKGAYVTSGAGALVMSYDQLGGTEYKDRTYNKVNEVNLHEMATMNYGTNVSSGKGGHSFNQVWTAKKSGFTLHTFSDDYKSLKTDFIGTDGSTLHTFTVTKGTAPTPTPPSPSSSTCKSLGCSYKYGNPCQCDSSCKKYGNCCSDYDSVCGGPSPPTPPTPGPPTPPTPGPPTPPSGDCCFYHATTCSHGDICCSSSGKGYQSESTCKKYGAAHSCQWEGGKCVVP
jgi:predicted MPP superfamily phosphohydrolase